MDIQSQMFGSFQLANIGAAACIGHYFDVPPAQIKKAIEAYRPANNRTQLLDWKGNRIILDAYNANPSSLGAVIDDFDKYDTAKKAAIVGDMLELGDASAFEHESMLRKIAGCHFDWVVCVGSAFGAFKSDFDFHFFATRDEAKLWLDEQSLIDYTLLIKGSRGLALEKLIAD